MLNRVLHKSVKMLKECYNTRIFNVSTTGQKKFRQMHIVLGCLAPPYPMCCVHQVGSDRWHDLCAKCWLVLSETEANAKRNRSLLCDTTLTLEPKRRSYSWLSFVVVIFCFRAQCTPSNILQQAVEVRSACGSSSTRSYVFSPFQISLSSSCPFHNSLTHSHFHLDKNSHWLSRGRRCMSK